MSLAALAVGLAGAVLFRWRGGLAAYFVLLFALFLLLVVLRRMAAVQTVKSGAILITGAASGIGLSLPHLSNQ